MFEDKYARLPEEPPMKPADLNPMPPTAGIRNNGLGTTSVRKRKRHSSKHNSSAGGGQTSSVISSSEDDISSGESSDDLDTSREDTVRQLRSLQEQVERLLSTISKSAHSRSSRIRSKSLARHCRI